MTVYTINSKNSILNLEEEDEIRIIKNGNIKYRISISCWNIIFAMVQDMKISWNPAERIDMERCNMTMDIK